MKEITIKKYITSDGREFVDYDLASEYEDILIRSIDFIKSMPDMKKEGLLKLTKHLLFRVASFKVLQPDLNQMLIDDYSIVNKFSGYKLMREEGKQTETLLNSVGILIELDKSDNSEYINRLNLYLDNFDVNTISESLSIIEQSVY